MLEEVLVRNVMVCLLVVSVVVGFSSAGCSHRSKKHKSESLKIITTTLPDAYEGVSYSYTVTASGGNVANYTWSIGGQPSWLFINSSTGELSGTPPANSAGTYTFTVTVDDGQQTASKQFDLTVNPAPILPKADFEANPTYGTASLTVNFTDKSAGTITQWQWDFDNDGITDSTDQNPTYTYNDPGWYTVKLTVTGPAGSDTLVKEKYILVADDVYYVDGVNGDDTKSGTDWSNAWKTIGYALSQAGDYDLVLVADATYNETDLNFNGKKIYLKGVDYHSGGLTQPVIDCQNNGRAFSFGSGETEDSVIDNFVIQNGKVEDSYGGAVICTNDSSPTITNCVFQNNRTVDVNGTYAEQGGAIYCSFSNPSITDCTFSGNSSDYEGGAISCRNSNGLTIENCIFSGNNARYGGAIYCSSSSPSITNCTFSSNSVSWFGGAIHCYHSSPVLTNCIFSGNSADYYGGAFSCEGSSAPSVINCTFSSNSVDAYGGAIYCDDSSNLTLNNCILWDNSATKDYDQIYIPDSGSSCTLNYCCVDNGAGAYGGSGTVDDSNHCIHSDPQFVNAANGDYHLKSTSACMDTGNNTYISGVDKDLDGKPRIVDGNNDGSSTVDIGAYEYQP